SNRTRKARAEVQPDGEQAIRDTDGGIRHSRRDLGAVAVRVEKRERQIVAPVGGLAAVGKPPLVTEGAALAEGMISRRAEAANGSGENPSALSFQTEWAPPGLGCGYARDV